MQPLCVLGLGLIGGSVLRAAHAAGIRCFGATASGEDAEAARAAGFDVREPGPALRAAAESDALVCVATPLTAVDEVLETVAEHAPRARLTDVISVKTPVRAAVHRHLPRARYVGGHPMAGTAESGWAACSAELFHGANWVVCLEPQTDLELWRAVAELVVACGARALPMELSTHDRAVARVSHLPHLFAEVLAAVGADDGAAPLRLAAGSFADGTRVAATRPELVRAMCEGNAEALVPVLDQAIAELTAARESLAGAGSLQALVRAGYRGRLALEAARADGSHELRVSVDELPELIRRGAAVVGFDGPRLIARY